MLSGQTMSFQKRSISDYVTDIPMRFSNFFSKIPSEAYLQTLDLKPIYVERFTESDFNYDFNVERIALEDAIREKERVLKEAEQKLKELELTNKLNETQVKKPIEDVINSSKPIQLINQSTSLANYENDFNKDYTIANDCKDNVEVSSSNYVYGPSNYVTQPAYNYTSSISELPHTSSTTVQPCQPNDVHSKASSSQTTPSSLLVNRYLPPANMSSSHQNQNVNQLSHLSNSLPQHQQNNLNQTNSFCQNLNAIYSQQFYSQSQMHTQPTLTTSQSNYNNSYPLTSSYPINSVYSLPPAYHHSIAHQQINDYNQSLTTDSNQKDQSIKTHSQMNYNSSQNYASTSSPYSMAGILLPQQSSLSTNNSNKSLLNNTKAPVTPKDVMNTVSNSNSIASNSTLTNSANAIPTTKNPSIKANGKKIDVADFENSSSPFDDALLRSIDDKEELNNIFQQFYQNGAK